MSSAQITVLVVDDEPGVRRLVVRILERAGLRTLTAEAGETAHALFLQHRDAIDLLLTDVSMPGVSGPELVRILRTEDPSLRVLFMSGYAAGGPIPGGTPGESVNLIRKPFTPEDLMQAVRSALAP